MNNENMEIGGKQYDNAVGLGNASQQYSQSHHDNKIVTPNNIDASTQNNSYIPESYKQILQNIPNYPKQIFSSAYEHMKWVLSLRWYVILLIVVFGSFVFFQIESAIEVRRKKREAKKEGMDSNNVERIKGILRKSEQDHKMDIAKKQVSFYTEESRQNVVSAFTGMSDVVQNSIENTTSNMIGALYRAYKWWILPWVYVLFRTIGMR